MQKIYINPGHSNIDPGAVGYETERRLNVAVSNHMKNHLLANYACEVKMTAGSVDSLTVICEEANKWGADLFVSNHFNAGGGDGFECYVYSEARRKLGQVFEKHVKAAGQNSRGVKIQPGFIVLRGTNMPAILTEGAFVDNRKDIQDWNDDAELKALGVAYAEAAAEVLQLKKNAAPQRSLDEVARAVIRGEYGNGTERAQRLRAAGHDPAAVQARVNELLTGAPAKPQKSLDDVARAVIRGEYGNGAERKKRLKAEGWDPAAVQARVNKML